MKSNSLKLVLPAFAILLAVGLAFATEDKTILQIAHYYDTVDQEWKSATAEEGCGEDGRKAIFLMWAISQPNPGMLKFKQIVPILVGGTVMMDLIRCSMTVG